MDTPTERLATLEPIGKVQWTRSRREDTAVVVGCKQLESAGSKVATERHQACEECVRSECCLPESLASW
jgi:hypothetical protein